MMHYYTCGNFVLAAVATLKFRGYDLQTIAPVTKTAVKALFRHYVQRQIIPLLHALQKHGHDESSTTRICVQGYQKNF